MVKRRVSNGRMNFSPTNPYVILHINFTASMTNIIKKLTALMQKECVALRLQAGSDEAGYLAQIFPLPKTPTIVLMKHGELKEYIAAGTSKEEFLRRVQGAFSKAQATASTNTASTSSTTDSSSTRATTTQSSATTSNTTPQSSENVTRVLAERAARLQAQKQEAERRAKEDREKAKEKAKAEAEAGIESQAASVHNQAELVKKKRLQQNEERRRILKKIEDDKEERRARAQERELIRLDAQKTGDVASALVNAPETKIPSTVRTGSMASLQVRLLDGSTIRSRFKVDQTMKDVRTWVDAERGNNKVAYKFKKVLTPLPNKNIDDTEEDQTLQALELAPSSTLVLIPVQQYAEAYAGASGAGNVFRQIFGLITGFFMWLLGLFGLAGNSTSSTSGSASQGRPPNEGTPSTQAARDERARKFDEDRRRQQQLYNGNSVRRLPHLNKSAHEDVKYTNKIRIDEFRITARRNG